MMCHDASWCHLMSFDVLCCLSLRKPPGRLGWSENCEHSTFWGSCTVRQKNDGGVSIPPWCGPQGRKQGFLLRVLSVCRRSMLTFTIPLPQLSVKGVWLQGNGTNLLINNFAQERRWEPRYIQYTCLLNPVDAKFTSSLPAFLPPLVRLLGSQTRLLLFQGADPC